MATTPVTVVLPRLVAGQRIADENGIADPRHVQTLNNAFANIAANEAALAANEEELAQQQSAQATLTQNVADALAALTQVQGQVSAVSGTLSTTALALSFTAPAVVLSAVTTNTGSTINVAPHVRHYADGSNVSVNGGSIPVSQAATAYYVVYHDTGRTGGAVSYSLATDPTAAVQLSGIHNVGSVYVSSGIATNSGTANYGPGVHAPAVFGGVA